MFLYHSKTLLVKQGTDLAEKRDIFVLSVTQTRKYGSKHKDALVVAHLNLTGSLNNNGTFDTRCATAYIRTSVSINNSNGNFLLSIYCTLHQQLKLVGTS